METCSYRAGRTRSRYSALTHPGRSRYSALTLPGTRMSTLNNTTPMILVVDHFYEIVCIQIRISVPWKFVQMTQIHLYDLFRVLTIIVIHQ